jgi:hypothetical protein
LAWRPASTRHGSWPSLAGGRAVIGGVSPAAAASRPGASYASYAADWSTRRTEASDLAVQAGFNERDALVLIEAARPALRLGADAGVAAAVAASKLGGLPDLPSDVQWPVGHFGPMAFCGQVRTGAAAALHGIDGWQPGDVLLSFFADMDPDSSEVEAGCVLVSDLAEVVRREPPAEHSRGRSLLDESRFVARPVLTPSMHIGGPMGLEHHRRPPPATRQPVGHPGHGPGLDGDRPPVHPRPRS